MKKNIIFDYLTSVSIKSKRDEVDNNYYNKKKQTQQAGLGICDSVI